jgi:hypothetical protein
VSKPYRRFPPHVLNGRRLMQMPTWLVVAVVAVLAILVYVVLIAPN